MGVYQVYVMLRSFIHRRMVTIKFNLNTLRHTSVLYVSCVNLTLLYPATVVVPNGAARQSFIGCTGREGRVVVVSRLWFLFKK